MIKDRAKYLCFKHTYSNMYKSLHINYISYRSKGHYKPVTYSLFSQTRLSSNVINDSVYQRSLFQFTPEESKVILYECLRHNNININTNPSLLKNIEFEYNSWIKYHALKSIPKGQLTTQINHKFKSLNHFTYKNRMKFLLSLSSEELRSCVHTYLTQFVDTQKQARGSYDIEHYFYLQLIAGVDSDSLDESAEYIETYLLITHNISLFKLSRIIQDLFSINKNAFIRFLTFRFIEPLLKLADQIYDCHQSKQLEQDFIIKETVERMIQIDIERANKCVAMAEARAKDWLEKEPLRKNFQIDQNYKEAREHWSLQKETLSDQLQYYRAQQLLVIAAMEYQRDKLLQIHKQSGKFDLFSLLSRYLYSIIVSCMALFIYLYSVCYNGRFLPMSFSTEFISLQANINNQTCLLEHLQEEVHVMKRQLTEIQSITHKDYCEVSTNTEYQLMPNKVVDNPILTVDSDSRTLIIRQLNTNINLMLQLLFKLCSLSLATPIMTLRKINEFAKSKIKWNYDWYLHLNKWLRVVLPYIQHTSKSL